MLAHSEQTATTRSRKIENIHAALVDEKTKYFKVSYLKSTAKTI